MTNGELRPVSSFAESHWRVLTDDWASNTTALGTDVVPERVVEVSSITCRPLVTSLRDAMVVAAVQLVASSLSAKTYVLNAKARAYYSPLEVKPA